MIEAINIYSKSADKLGRDLTNPSYAKRGKSEFDIQIPSSYKQPKDYILPNIKDFGWAIKKYGEGITAKDVWGNSVEAWYFANRTEEQTYNEELMSKLIQKKFKTYPNLISQIDERGGLEFLELCEHTVNGNGSWEGKGLKSNFIKVLIDAYNNIKIEEKHPDTSGLYELSGLKEIFENTEKIEIKPPETVEDESFWS
jgi:hypothetical protein